jgi:hypothetical protein
MSLGNRFGPGEGAVKLRCTCGEDAMRAYTADGHKFNPPNNGKQNLPVEKIREDKKREDEIDIALTRVSQYYFSISRPWTNDERNPIDVLFTFAELAGRKFRCDVVDLGSYICAHTIHGIGR